MLLVWFVYGLAFFALGLAILVYPKRDSRFALARYIWMVGVFGIVHGVNEWLDMFIAIGGPLPPGFMAHARMATLSVSFFFLILFGTTVLCGAPGRCPLLGILPVVLAGAWLIVLASAGPGQRLLVGDIWARYLLCLPGAILAAAALFRQAPVFGMIGRRSSARWVAVAGGTFLVYGVLAGVFVKKAGFFPASLLNYETFTAATGLPVQIFRALCAVVAAWSLIRLLDVFRWEAQENLRISELRCATITSAVPAFLFMADRDLVITFIQGKGLEALGLDPERARGRPTIDVLEAGGNFTESCRRALAGAAFMEVATIAGVPFEVYYSALKDAAGEVSHVVGVALDVSAQIAARRELDEYRHQMEKRARDAEVGVLSAIMGRQIAEPLSIAQLTLEKLVAETAEAGASDAVRRTIGRGLSEVAKANEALAHFLHIAHPGPTDAEQPIGLYQIAKRTAGVFAESAQRKGLTIAIKEMDLVPVMTVSPREMEQIFYQLVQWAVDAPREGAERRLVISCSASDRSIELVFSHVGGGGGRQRPADLGAPGSEGIDGMGLGLAVVKQIIAAHGGEMTLETLPGEGVVFRIRLPVTRVY